MTMIYNYNFKLSQKQPNHFDLNICFIHVSLMMLVLGPDGLMRKILVSASSSL